MWSNKDRRSSIFTLVVEVLLCFNLKKEGWVFQTVLIYFSCSFMMYYLRSVCFKIYLCQSFYLFVVIDLSRLVADCTSEQQLWCFQLWFHGGQFHSSHTVSPDGQWSDRRGHRLGRILVPSSRRRIPATKKKGQFCKIFNGICHFKHGIHLISHPFSQNELVYKYTHVDKSYIDLFTCFHAKGIIK